MYLKSIASVVPPLAATQQQSWEALKQSPILQRLRPRSAALLESILRSETSGLRRRHFACDSIAQVFDHDAQALARHYEREAPLLASNALRKALDYAQLTATELDAVFLCSCTGYLCPGVSSHVAELSGVRSDAFLTDLVGMGCGAAVPNLRTAKGFLAAHPHATVATIAVEICSAAFFLNDDPGVLISLCLFGDGANAAIWTGAPESSGSWQAGHFTTVHHPHHREKIRFVNDGGKLKNQLHRAVPELAAAAVAELFSRRKGEPDQILAHSGGREVIDALEAHLPFTLSETREVLRERGNMSSPSMMMALQRRLDSHPQDRRLWLTGFGAGFAAHACELWR